MSIPSEAAIPDSRLAHAITEFVRDSETELLFNHSSRVYHFGALAGIHRGLSFDRELLYAGAMFHDLGLMLDHSSADERFEVDGANAARSFLKAHGVSEADGAWLLSTRQSQWATRRPSPLPSRKARERLQSLQSRASDLTCSTL